MISGAFSSMPHTHRFTQSGEGTLMEDEFQFTAPFGFFGRIAEGLCLTGYTRRFLTKRAAELEQWAESEKRWHWLTDNGEQAG